MKKAIFYGFLIAAAFLVQTTLFASGSIVSASPDLLLIVTVSCAILHGRVPGMAAGFFAGLAADLFQGRMVGFYALLFVLTGYFAGRLYKVYFENNASVPAIVVLAADLVCGFVTYVVKFFLRGRIHLGGYLIRVMIPEAVVTAVFALIVYRFIYVAEKKFLREEKRGQRRTWLRD